MSKIKSLTIIFILFFTSACGSRYANSKYFNKKMTNNNTIVGFKVNLNYDVKQKELEDIFPRMCLVAFSNDNSKFIKQK